MNDVKRKLASVQEIIDVQPIDGADRIEVITVLGWKVVSRKGEFKVGDKCIYFEVDSLIPRNPWNDFLASKSKPDAPIRLKTVRFRGQISQGLAIPLGTIIEANKNNIWEVSRCDMGRLDNGLDATGWLGVEKWEHQVPACLSGEARGAFPPQIFKTDEIRIQSEPDLLEEFKGVEVYWTVKMDGTSGTFGNIDGDHHVCSRNLSLLDTGKNTYWEMYHQYGLKSVLDDAGCFAIQGEVCGEGIQKNRAGLKGHHLLVFNVLNIKEGKFLDYADYTSFCLHYALTTVPLHKIGVFDIDTVDEIVEYGTGCEYPNGATGEGYVIRPTVEKFSKVLNSRSSFKIINNNYLTKHDE